jgi:DNA-binding GntR family transcriptional regulator
MTSTKPEASVSDEPGYGEPVDSQRRAYERVRQLILLGQLEPGAWVSQVQMAAELKLSRTPLREALRRLESEGLVQLDFNRMVRVAPLSVEDLESLYALRLVGEPLAVRLTIPELSESELAEIADSLAETNAAADRGDETTLLEAHRRFHFGLISHAPGRLKNHVEGLWDHAVRYVRVYHPVPSYRMSLVLMGRPEHDRILAAATSRQSALAARLTADHLARTALTVVATVAGGYDPRIVRETLRFVLESAPEVPVPDQGRGVQHR